MTEKSYPTVKVTLLFGLIGFLIGSILGLWFFIAQQKALYDLEHYGKLLQRDEIPYQFAFLAPVVMIGLYGMVVGGILAYQRTVWRKNFFDTTVYLRLVLASMFASTMFAVFLMIINISPFFAVIFYPMQIVFTLISALLFFPKAKGEK